MHIANFCTFNLAENCTCEVTDYNSTHVYHQYTLKVKDGMRNALKEHLLKQGIPSMIYYPLPLNKQNAFKNIVPTSEQLNVSTELAQSVLSLPMHTELSEEEQKHIITSIQTFFK